MGALQRTGVDRRDAGKIIAGQKRQRTGAKKINAVRAPEAAGKGQRIGRRIADVQIRVEPDRRGKGVAPARGQLHQGRLPRRVVEGERAAVAGQVERAAGGTQAQAADDVALVEINGLIGGDGGVDHGHRLRGVGKGRAVGPVPIDVPALRRSGDGVRPINRRRPGKRRRAGLQRIDAAAGGAGGIDHIVIVGAVAQAGVGISGISRVGDGYGFIAAVGASEQDVVGRADDGVPVQRHLGISRHGGQAGGDGEWGRDDIGQNVGGDGIRNQRGGKTFIRHGHRRLAGEIQIPGRGGADDRSRRGQRGKTGKIVAQVQTAGCVVGGHDDERLVGGIVSGEGIVIIDADDFETGPDVFAELAHDIKLFVDGVVCGEFIRQRIEQKPPATGVVHDLPVNPRAHGRAGDVIVDAPRHGDAAAVAVAVFGKPGGLVQAGRQTAQAARIFRAVGV